MQMLQILGASALAALSLHTVAGMSMAQAPSGQAAWPDEATVTIGEVRTRIDGPKMWTMSGLDYQGSAISTEESAYGAVFTIRGVGHLGTAHFLDVPGKPGEIEKENVTSLKLLVDGKPIAGEGRKFGVSGSSFRMERTSKIRDIDLKSSVSIRDGILIETQQVHANKAVDLQMTYPLMYAWAPQTTHYAFGDDNGIQKRGRFAKEGKSNNDGREPNSRWMAVYNVDTGKGAVCYLLETPNDAKTLLQWTDAPGIYLKLRIMSFIETVMPEGFDGTYQSAVAFFNATEQDWEQKALERVAVLKKVDGAVEKQK